MTHGEEMPIQRRIVNIDALPACFPTHRHDPSFWEALGRTVATFGFLEEVLKKAIFSFTATKPYDASEINSAYEKWLPTLEKILTDPLGNLIKKFGESVREHPDATIKDLDDLLAELRKTSDIRNALCHGSWEHPDANGKSVLSFVNQRREVLGTPIDCQFLDRTQQYVAELSCEVINTVTHMGWQFPGSSGPGIPIWKD